MDCISCGEDGVFNRVVVNQVSNTELGLYCEACESEQFGSLLSDPMWHQSHGCAFCDEPGKYSLPNLECLIESDTGDARIIEYTIHEHTVTICEQHLAALMPDDALQNVVPKELPERQPLEA